MRRPTVSGALCMASVLAVVLTSCTSGAIPPAPPRDWARPPITVASFDFPESELLADIYAQALRAKGYPVEVLPGVGSRELVEPALARGLIQFVPEYQGSALAFLTLGESQGSPDPAATHRALAEALGIRDIVATEPAPAQDANAIVVTEATALRYGLHSISDLRPVASKLAFGGPKECPLRPFCLLGLERTYGLRFEQFIPLDTGGPLTLQALAAGEIDVAVLFTTDPSIPEQHLVALTDDRRLQPAENVTPLLRRDIVARYGSGLIELVNSVSSRLTTDQLRSMNSAMSVGGRPPAAVARGWLQSQGLVQGT